MRCVFSPLAEADMEEIGDYIAQDNPSRAISFIREIRMKCTKIKDQPLASPLRPNLGEGIRMAVFGKYLIFYSFDEMVVRIERILHGARDISELFDE
jgi:toxin ParE1/3/4